MKVLVLFAGDHCVPGKRGPVAAAFHEYSTINHSGGKLEVVRYFDYDELAEISGAFYLHTITLLVGCDGLDLHEILAEHTIRSLGHGIVPLDAKHDLSEKLTQLTQDGEMTPGHLFVFPRHFH